MRFIKNTTWPEVFAGWRERESGNPGWVRCAQEKGWPDWESWRKNTAEQIKADQRAWQIFEFTDPAEEIPQMLIGPYSSWQARVTDKNKTSFEQLLNIPEPHGYFSRHDGVLLILKGLPFSTEMIGLILDDINKIVCLEGHHRATAIALAKRQGKKIDYSGVQMTIALTHLSADERQLLDELLKKGTAKDFK